MHTSEGNLPYALSWYLDITSNGKWNALVLDDYQAICPLPFNRKLFGFQQIYQPPFTQQLGVFGNALTAEIVQKFLDAIPRQYKRVHFNINFHNANLLELAERRTNLVLNLNKSYEEIRANYHKSLRKRLNKTSNLIFEEADSPTELVEFYRSSLSARVHLPTSYFQRIENLITHALASKRGNIYRILDEAGDCLALSFFLNVNGRVINLFGASNESGRLEFAMHKMLDEVIQLHTESNATFDFEGSEIKGVKLFFESFGSVNEPYGSFASS
ncbi:MAG: hypothetical protein ACI8ZN_000541 [Bacteroidia bacterium]